MAFRAAGISAGPAVAAALAAFFASGSAWAAAVFAIATVAGSALGPGRAEFIHAEVSVAIRIELGEDCRGVGDLHRVDDSVTVGVESGDHRGDRASATFWPGRRVGGVVGRAEAEGGGGYGGQEQGLVDEFHDVCRLCVLFCFRRLVRSCFDIKKHPAS